MSPVANETLTAWQQNVPFEILERDTSAADRGQGWAITLHWALPLLREILPEEVLDRIKRCRVNSHSAADDDGSFKLINLKDCSEIQNTPTGERWRVNRGKLRLALLEGLDDHIQWDRHVVNIEQHEDLVEIRCSDGETYIADVVIGADGSGSAIRRSLCPENHAVTPLPYRMLGVGTELTGGQVAPLRSIDQLLFQGCESDTGNFLYCSLLEPSTRDTSSCVVQFNISWPKSLDQEEIFSDNVARLAALKRRARGFAPCLKDAIESIPDGTPVSEIVLADWETPHWNRSGRVTLIGDAAHPMLMCKNLSSINLVKG
jgi:2-polyprenyl-6-methoxyphenol hydroxylase-like FAD-dependent oxidoreductase